MASRQDKSNRYYQGKRRDSTGGCCFWGGKGFFSLFGKYAPQYASGEDSHDVTNNSKIIQNHYILFTLKCKDDGKI